MRRAPIGGRRKRREGEGPLPGALPRRAGEGAGLTALAAAMVVLGCAGRTGGDAGSMPGSAAVLPAAEAVPLTVEPWTFQGRQGSAYRSTHYRLLTTVDRTILVSRLSPFAEASLARFGEAFPTLPEARPGLEVFVLRSRAEWRRFVAEVWGAEGLARYDAIERGGFTERGRSVLWDIGVQDTFAIMAHEGWHQYVQTSLREPLPTWLDEGIAAWAEGFRWNPVAPDEPVFLPWANVERFDQLRRASERGELMPLGQLLTERPQELIRVSSESTLTYYAQCWALVHYLMADPTRRGALDLMLGDAASGRMSERVRASFGDRAVRSIALRRSGIEIWRAYVDDDLAAEERRYAEFLERVVRPGSKGAIVSGRSPLE